MSNIKLEEEDIKQEEEAGEFEVEKVLDRRISQEGRLEYFLTWKGYPEEENSWEPKSNLNCPILLARFKKARKKRKNEEKRKSMSGSRPKSKKTKELRGVDRVLEPEGVDRVLEPQVKNEEKCKSKSGSRPTSKKTKEPRGVDPVLEPQVKNEEKRKSKSGSRPKSKKTKEPRGVDRVLEPQGRPRPNFRFLEPEDIDREMEPDRIIAATDQSGSLRFLIAWKGTNEVNFVASQTANKRWPQVVIKFYEDRVIYYIPEAPVVLEPSVAPVAPEPSVVPVAPEATGG